ncbi:BTAD domain-containing putative transcriptional regulator [Streptomyces gilvifuscus]|uniref:BTAD domain-containing putative transcriptional regulator n=1 Tax=Streptomyces gilvifuscus TaxID=1550617 RepID=A0ABT5FKG4_9ACTN|nr:BTAD domain-containing putative transcriptional regulator [Streptomyces gilvifuscus]MDC2952996.1 BTAD domain-containing putative transcriptional regulator [Streptomyces gilvifuscus]
MNAANSTDLRFSVLGPVRAWHADRELDLGSPQQRAVLAALLLRRGHPVSLAELVDAVWGVEPPAAAVSVLRTYVSRLRKVLEPGRGPEDPPRTIVSVGDGYRARVPEQALDLAVFERRTAEAAKAVAAGEESTAAQLLHDALDGWPGAALAGVPGPLAESERARLAEERLSALENRLDLDVRLGRHGQVIAELMSLAGEHPLREELCRLLMLALYRSGRQAEALAAYRGTRATLVTELGIEPGAPLRELHARILATDASLNVGDPARPMAGETPPQEPQASVTPQQRQTRPSSTSAAQATAPASPAPQTKTPEPSARRPAYAPRLAQLPADLPTFTGREAELKATLGMLPLDGSAPATLVISAIGGMAGVGKTTLAVHLAHRVADRFPDGQLCVNLRGFDPTGSVMSSHEAIRVLLDALGVPPQRLPAGLEAQTALYRSVLAERRVLILLDNARDAEQVRPLLPGSPGCFVIVTSRNQLTGLVAGEGAHPLTLNQLTPAEAHEFLARRLGATRLEREPGAVDEIISRCALLPLALAVVAARAATHPDFPLSAIAEELRDSDDSLDAFAGDDITIDVRTVFSLSYEALSAPAARLFRLLGLHAGPDLSSPAAAALAGLTPRETRGLLVELTRAHLLTEYFPGRYTLHDLLRVYAAERVRAEETPRDRDLAVERLLYWYLHTAAAAYPLITPNRNPIPLDPPPASCRPLSFTTLDQAVDWCETERSNLVGAVHQAADSGQPSIAWQLPAVLWGFFYLRSHLGDWLDTTRTGLSAARAAQDSRGEARCLLDAAAALSNAKRYDEAIDHLHQAITACRQLGDADGTLRAVANLGDAYLQADKLDRAVEYSRRGLALAQAAGDIWGEGIILSNLGDGYQRLGRFDQAVDCLEQALTVLRESGNRWVEGVALDVLGTVHHRLGARDRAVAYYRQALDAHRDIGNRWGEGHTLGHLGDVQLAAGEQEAADGSWRQALGIFAEFDHPDAAKMQEKLRSLQLASR